MEIDPSNLATKQDLHDAIALLRSEMKEGHELLRSEMKEGHELLRSEMAHMRDDLKESMRDIQTELLKAFYNYGQTNDLKMKDLEGGDINLRQRLTVVESRVTDLERRINTPPPSN